MVGNIKHLWEVAEISNDDKKYILKEYYNGNWKLDNASVQKYKNRVYESLDDKVKEKVIATAKNDIYTIIAAMKPTEKELLLYRSF